MSREDAEWARTQTVHNPARQRWDYYRGDHPRVYVTSKLREMFAALAESMTENYCALAVDARVSRLRVEGWDGPAAEQAEAVWAASGLAQHQDRVMRWALAEGWAALVVDMGTRTIVGNPGRLLAYRENPDDPEQLDVVGKVWADDEGGTHVTLWYADRTEMWHAPEQGTFREKEGSPVPQPAGRVPVVLIRPYSDGAPLLDHLIPIQDRINKLGANKMVAAEFGAFRQRAFITRQELDPFAVRQAPDHAIVLDPGDPDGPTRVHEFAATDLRNYDDAKTAEIDGLFTVAALPRHMRGGNTAQQSGEAIRADEGPLVAAVRDHQREVGEALTSALAMLDVQAEPVWSSPETSVALSAAQEFALLVSGGMPWQAAATRALDMTADDIARAEQWAVAAGGDLTGAALLAGA